MGHRHLLALASGGANLVRIVIPDVGAPPCMISIERARKWRRILRKTVDRSLVWEQLFFYPPLA
jgi:hypothetical protein